MGRRLRNDGQFSLGLFESFDAPAPELPSGPVIVASVQINPTAFEPVLPLIGSPEPTIQGSDPQAVPATIGTDEIAALRKRRDDAHAVLVTLRKTPALHTPQVDADYLAELGALERRLWDLGHQARVVT